MPQERSDAASETAADVEAPVLQSAETEPASQRKLSLDWLAVLLALIAVILVRFSILRQIPW